MLETQALDAILERHNREPANVIAILQDIQAEVNWLPEEDLRYVCVELDIPPSKMMALATFYKAFSLQPRGKHIVQVCLGTACHVRGAVRILETVERELGIEGGQTDEDLQWTLETVGCLGACALGPIVVVDGEYHGQMTSAKATRLLQKIKKADGEVDFKDAQEVYNKYRAFEGWPGIFAANGTKFDGLSLVENEKFHQPFELLSLAGESIIVGCEKGSLKIETIQPASKKAVLAKAYCVGRGIKVGSTIL